MSEVMVIVILAVTVAVLLVYIWQHRDNFARDRSTLIAQITRLEETLQAKDVILLERDRTSLEKDRLIVDKDHIITDLENQLAENQTKADYRHALILTLANAAYDALVVVDQDCRILAINDSAEALFDRELPLGESLVDVTHVPEMEMMVQDAITNEEESFEEQMTIHQRNFRVRTQVARRNGHYFVALALQDVTQLVRLNRARRDMVANISHELRTPIANIRLIIDGLFHDQDKPKRKDSISSLRAVARETDNLLWLVQEMSDLAMIESGQAIVRMVDVPLYEVVDESIERMTELADLKHIKLVRYVPEKLHVLCDRDLAQRVLINLIHNAIKWSPSGDVVTINATNGGDEVTISVLDSGPGVSPDLVDRIFERFYQVDPSRSSAEGSGLGLAICRHIVEAHGGRIWAEDNRDGRGGRFMFTLLSAGHEQEEGDLSIAPSGESTI